MYQGRGRYHDHGNDRGLTIPSTAFSWLRRPMQYFILHTGRCSIHDVGNNGIEVLLAHLTTTQMLDALVVKINT